MVGRSRRRPGVKPTLTVHQIVAYNFRRAREEEGWTQAQTSDQLEPYLGYKLNQAGVSAVEKTFDSDRRRNIDVSEVVAFSRCFRRPIGWFFLPPPEHGTDLVEPTYERSDFNLPAANLAALVIGSPRGWESFVRRITELLDTDVDAAWQAMHLAFAGVKDAGWEKQIDLRRRALQQVTLARFAGPADDVITSMAALLVELVKLTPLGAAHLRETDPDEALELLAEGDRLVRPLIRSAKERREQGMKSSGGFDDLEDVDLLEALGRLKKSG
jgi:hypothetical protein